MDPELRIVTSTPLRELWRDDGYSTSARGKSLSQSEVHELLKCGPVQFVVADVGSALRWIPITECFQFWKDEVKFHVANGTGLLNDFPGRYFYFASLWEGIEPTFSIALLEMVH